MGPIDIIYLTNHDTELKGSRGNNNYLVGAFSSLAESRGGYFYYWGSALLFYLGGNYSSYPSRGPTGHATC